MCGFPVLGGCLGFWFVLGVSLDFASRVYGLHGFRFYEGRFVGFDLLCSSVYCFDCYGAGFCRFGGLDCGFCFLGLELFVLGFLGDDGFSGSGFGWVVVPGVDFVVVLGFWYACFALVVTGLLVVL